jgi:hypothetical protein
MWQTTLNDLYAILAAGEPPLAYRFLLINTFAMIVFVLRRMSGRKPLDMRSANMMQFSLIVANCIIAATGQISAPIGFGGL